MYDADSFFPTSCNLITVVKESRVDNKVTSDYILGSLLSVLIRTSYLTILLPTVFHAFPATDEALIILWDESPSSLHNFFTYSLPLFRHLSCREMSFSCMSVFFVISYQVTIVGRSRSSFNLQNCTKLYPMSVHFPSDPLTSSLCPYSRAP
jgi:hypothetical protein